MDRPTTVPAASRWGWRSRAVRVPEPRSIAPARRSAPWALVVSLLATAPAPARAQCCQASLAVETRWPPQPAAFQSQPVWITADSLGHVSCGYHVDGFPALLRSQDGGETWGPPELGVADGATTFRAAASPSGALVAVLVKTDGVWCRSSADFGDSWSAPVLVASGGTPSFVAADIELQVHDSGLAAVRLRWIEPSFRTRLRAAVSLDSGGSWGPALELGDTDAVVTASQQLAVDGDTVVVAWADGPDLYTRRSSDAGASWEPATPVNAAPALGNGATITPVALATTGEGHFQVAYFGLPTPTYELRVAHSGDGAVTWPGEAVVASAAAVSEAVRLVSPSTGRLVVTGWREAGAGPGLQATFSADHGRPGSWSAPSTLVPDGTGLHHFRTAVLQSGRILLVHDDYRVQDSGSCFGGTGQCESIFLQLHCGAGDAWDGPELRLDADGPDELNHSEDAEITTDGLGRVHVIWSESDDVGAEGLGMRHVAVDIVADVFEVDVMELPPDECNPRGYRLDVPAAVLVGCGSPVIRWYRDGVLLPGAEGSSLRVSGATTPPGEHGFQYELSCEPPRACGELSDTAILVVDPDPNQPPEAVGDALRVTDHGDPLAADITARLSWAGDAAAPRPPEQHYHVLRGGSAALALLGAVEPWRETELAESTPASPSLTHVWFYEVLAADACERESLD